MQLSPLQSRLAASVGATVVVLLLYLALFTPHLALAAEISQISVLDITPDETTGRGDLSDLSDSGDLRLREPVYEPEVAHEVPQTSISCVPDTDRPSQVLEQAPLLDNRDLEASYVSHSSNGPGQPTITPSVEAASECEPLMKHTTRGTLEGWNYRVKLITSPRNLQNVGATAVRSLPSVLLGALLNILDGVSCAQ